MEFSSPLIKGKLIKRYKRFLADVELENGEIVTAHCPNTGAMTGCAEPGWTAYLRYAPSPKRKLAYTWELAETDQGDWIGINTNNANKVVAEALSHNPDLFDFTFSTYKAECHVNGGASRFDFVLFDTNGQPCRVVEVKSVTLNDKGTGYFPDAVTARGAKHCDELGEIAKSGLACSLIYCVQHTGIKTVEPAVHIDSQYAEALAKAVQNGVTVAAFKCEISAQKIQLKQGLPVYQEKTG